MEGIKFHDARKTFSWRKKMDFMASYSDSWRRKNFMTRVWIHDGPKKSMTGHNEVSWRIWDFMTRNFFSWRKFHHFMTLISIHDGKKVDFRDALSLHSLVRSACSADLESQTSSSTCRLPTLAGLGVFSGRFLCWRQDRLGWSSRSTSGSVPGVLLLGFYQ